MEKMESPEEGRPFKASPVQAFTLAEVLITLGIIGVVAAITIPTLIRNYQERAMVNKIKLAHSQLHNAIQFYIAQNNCANSFCLFDTNKTSYDVAAELATVISGAKVCTPATYNEKYCTNYIIKSNTPYIVDGVYERGDSMDYRGRIVLPNGILIRITQQAECERTREYIIRDEFGYDTGERRTETFYTCAYIYVDVNNIEEPNQLGADIYRYDVKENGKIEPFNPSLINSVMLKNKLNYTPYNIGDPVR